MRRRPSPFQIDCYRYSQWLVVLVLAAISIEGHAAKEVPRALRGVDVAEHLGTTIDTNLTFVDHQGRSRTLGSFFDGKRPTLLTLNYYRCPMLCTLQLNALVEALRPLTLSPAEDFRIVTVSIDPTETAELAAKKRANYLETLKRDPVDWTFLVGRQKQISKLAGDLGFRYEYDATTKQYAHPAVVFLLSPDGRVSRYLYGIDFPAKELKFALLEASQGRLGSTVDRVVLSCFQYNPTTGRYSTRVMGIMRLAGGLALVVIGLFVGLYWRRERRLHSREDIA